MAHKKRRSRGFVVIPFDNTLALSTLGDGLVLTTSLTGSNFTEDLFIMSVDMNAMITGLTAGEGIPTDIGLAHGDYSATEVKEATEVVLLGPGSKIEQEQSRRQVRKTGVMNAFVDSGNTEMQMIGRDGSRYVRTKIKFVAQSGKSLKIYVKNRSGAALTTGAILRFSGDIYGRWLV